MFLSKYSKCWTILFITGALHAICNAEVKKEIALDDLVVIILSQPNVHHASRAAVTLDHVIQQYQKERDGGADVYLLHERWPQIGAWTILPILEDIVKKFPEKSAVFFCEEETRVDLVKLLSFLGKYDFTKEMFFGKSLRDQEATIIHHFAFHGNPTSFVYPDFAAGFLLSLPLIKSISERIKNKKLKTDFAIDPKHELAMAVWDNGEGLRMTDVPFLCTKKTDERCSTSYQRSSPVCGPTPTNDEVFYAVKTCKKFHEDRVPVVKDTWGKDVSNIEYYSEIVDSTIPTIDLGVPNTDSGHCGKTMAIINRFREHNRQLEGQFKWLVIADDDTLLSVHALHHLLTCYDHEEPVVIGERYGYALLDSTGYNYLTGGGGMVFSYTAVKMLIDLGQCECPANHSPDDMILGLCFKRLGIIPVHSPSFHQARPADYSKGYLENYFPVSFHKHWMIDPREVYAQWLSADTTQQDQHTEL